MIIALYGMPGSGKGSQAKYLSKHYNLMHISTGDLIRYQIKNKTGDYRELESFVNNGKLIPDDVVTNMLKKEILKYRDRFDGFLFDGYPRTEAQYALLEQIIDQEFKEKITNLFIWSDEEVVKKRILGRRTCEQCQSIYNIYSDGEIDTCKKCGGKIIIRKDDSEEVFLKRLKEYNEFTKPLVDFLKNKGILFSVDGNTKSIEDLYTEITSLIDKIYGGN